MAKVPARIRAMEHARKFIGTTEQPPGSNRGPRIDQWERRAFGGTGEPWCACFVWCMFDDVGRSVNVQFKAAVASWVDWADRTNNHVARPYRGDLVAYSWDGRTNHPNDHIGFIEKVLAIPWARNGRRYYLKTVEGNTGDAVRQRWRWVDPKTVAFIRVTG